MAPPNAAPVAAAPVVEEISTPPPFDEAAAVDTLKSLVARAMESLPAESPSTSQRSTPEPGSVSVSVVGIPVDQDSTAKKVATRDQVLEAVTKGISQLGRSGGGERDEAGRIPSSFMPTLLSTLLTSSAESSASRSVAAIVVAAFYGVVEAAPSDVDGQNSAALMPAFEALLAQTPALEATVPKIKSVAANVAAQVRCFSSRM